MNYLRITNNGLICQEDLMLIGSSTKREQTGKIGMFGSGWKYALAWLLRNDCTPRIFSGTDEIKVDFNMKMHRDNPVRVITINGNETSLTTEMGPKWSGWMALREVISNAIDEGGNTLSTQWEPIMNGVDGETVIYIPMNSQLSEVMMKYDKYFAFERKANYETSTARIFIKQESSEINIYRKGIRCFDGKDISKLDFDFHNIDINEDRLCNSYNIEYAIRDIVTETTDPLLLKLILEEGNTDYLPWSIDTNTMVCLKALLASGETFTTPTLVKLGGLLFSDPNALFIRAEWYKTLQDLGLVKSPFESFGGDVQFMRTDAKSTEGIIYYLKAFNINIEVRSGKCEKEAFVRNGVAYIRDDSALEDKQVASHILGEMKKAEWERLME